MEDELQCKTTIRGKIIVTIIVIFTVIVIAIVKVIV